MRVTDCPDTWTKFLDWLRLASFNNNKGIQEVQIYSKIQIRNPKRAGTVQYIPDFKRIRWKKMKI
jgi:hypothetical protein